MSKKKLIEVSKFLSYILRHKPEDIGLRLDSEGWAKISDLIIGANKKGHNLDVDLISRVVATSDKKRFALSENQQFIRAVQGHSTSTVSISFTEKIPPVTLYHGTALKNVELILQEGLRPGSRHHVHLSDNKGTARQVGMRYGKPVIFAIDALKMQADGYKFYQAENTVWLTLIVPPGYISILDGN